MKIARINAYHYPSTQPREQPDPYAHSCSKCRTPFGISNIPCPNNPRNQ